MNILKKYFKFLVMVLLFFGAKVDCIHAATPQVELNVEPLSDSSNGYGGVSIQTEFKNIDYSDYEYVIKRSEDCITWDKIGMGFNYDKEKRVIVPRKVKVLNVYPDNESVCISKYMIDKYTWEELELIRKSYVIADGRYRDKNNNTIIMPRSASLKVWLEGGSYQEGMYRTDYSDISYYKGKKMIEVEQMSMKEFNNLNDLSQLDDFDTIFFGTWDANYFNDLSDKAAELLEKYIKAGKGVVFGHDTISYEVEKEGIYTGMQGCQKFCSFMKYMGFESIPKMYQGSSLNKKNSAGYILNREYQIWGGSNTSNSVVVRFAKAQSTKDFSLTTFPYDLLGENGKARDLVVPQTHTSWMQLNNAQSNIVSFVNNQYDILPDSTRKAYEDNPNMKFNWYLCSGNPAYACYAIQTGHSRNNSLEDERKLIANVLCYSCKKEYLERNCTSGEVKADTSAQDIVQPEIDDVEILSVSNSDIGVRFKGTDYGKTYYYYCDLSSASKSVSVSSQVKRVNVTTGIKEYIYLLDDKESNYCIDKDNYESVSADENKNGFTLTDVSYSRRYLHVQAIDYAGNISEPMCIDLSKKYKYEIYPIELINYDLEYVYKEDVPEDAIRHYYINNDYKFKIRGGCYLGPFASEVTQPYSNNINKMEIKTELDEELGYNNETILKNEALDENITAKLIVQRRSDESRKLKFEITAGFNDGSDGISKNLIPSAYFKNNSKNKKVSGDASKILKLTCDGSAPSIEMPVLKEWYNANNYKEAFAFKYKCVDSISGIDYSCLFLKKKELGNMRIVATKTSNGVNDCIFNYMTSSQEGTFEYSVVAYDNVSNSSSKSLNFKVDLQKPKIKNVESVYGWTNTSVKIDVLAEDRLSGVKQLELYNEAGELITQIKGDSLKYEFMEEQNSKYFIVATDKAGNVSDREYFEIKIDKTRPKIYGNELLDENKKVENGDVLYFLPGNTINVCASDDNTNMCSGIQALLLKDQNNNLISKIENEADNINNELNLVYEIKNAGNNGYYIIMAIDYAGNSSDILVVPPICTNNKIKRNILHDNYNDEYGYYRIYE